MTPEPPNDPPPGAGAPVPAAADGDPKDATAEVAASVALEEADPPVKTTPAQEWGAAIVLMILFMFICVAAVSFFRG